MGGPCAKKARSRPTVRAMPWCWCCLAAARGGARAVRTCGGADCARWPCGGLPVQQRRRTLGEADLRQLTGLAGSLTKYHCRTYWSAPLPADTDAALQARWAALDAPRKILDGRFVSRPGVFAWDRIDPASALLVEHLPTTLAGHGADLGAGFGYLSAEVLARCPRSPRWICTKPRRAH